MKFLIRHVLVNLLGIYLTSLVVTGLSWRGDLKALLLAAAALGLINVTVRTVVKLITLPLNIATLGLFTFVINALMLYLVTILVPAFTVTDFYFSGLNLGLIIIPSLSVARLWSFVVIAGIISVISTFVNWLVHKD